MNKKGILLRETLYLLLAILLIAIIFASGLNAYSILKSNKEEAQAKGTLDQLESLLEGLEKGETGIFSGYAPNRWWLVSFFKSPETAECFAGACICICEEESCEGKRFCREINKNLITTNKEQIKIQFISSLVITANDVFEAVVRSYPPGYKRFEPSSDTAIDRFFAAKYPTLKGLGECIQEASKRSDVPAALIIAVAIHESDGGKSELAGESCPLGPSQFSNNLFGITGKQGTTGYCNWKTKECLDETEGIGKEKCELDCGMKKCYWVERPFRAYHDKCQSINDFVDLMRDKEEYKNAIEKYRNDFEAMAKEIGTYYATDPNWGKEVALLVSEAREGVA